MEAAEPMHPVDAARVARAGDDDQGSVDKDESSALFLRHFAFLRNIC